RPAAGVASSVPVQLKVALPGASTSPVGPLVMTVSGGVASATVKDATAGVGSSLPAASRALTENTYCPGARFVYVLLVAVPNAEKPVSIGSRRNAKVRPAVGVTTSDPVHVTVTFLSVTTTFATVVSGGVASTTANDRLAGVKSSLPA